MNAQPYNRFDSIFVIIVVQLWKLCFSRKRSVKNMTHFVWYNFAFYAVQFLASQLSGITFFWNSFTSNVILRDWQNLIILTLNEKAWIIFSLFLGWYACFLLYRPGIYWRSCDGQSGHYYSFVYILWSQGWTIIAIQSAMIISCPQPRNQECSGILHFRDHILALDSIQFWMANIIEK